jgi:hypothetical protein
LEEILKEEEATHALETMNLQNGNKKAIDLFHQLDERINFVATKVLHLGDQLESVNIPRARAVEAQKLMRHFSDFLTSGSLTESIFIDKLSVSSVIKYFRNYLEYIKYYFILLLHI